MRLMTSTAIGILPDRMEAHDAPPEGMVRSRYEDGTEVVEPLPPDGVFRRKVPGPVSIDYTLPMRCFI